MAPRKPNYDFERREREKAKAAKKEDRAKAKAERNATPEADQAKADQAGQTLEQ